MTLRLQGRRTPLFAFVMRAASWPGFAPQSRVLPPAVIAAWLGSGRQAAGLLQAVAWGGALLSTAVKAAVDRPRPLAPEVEVVLAPLGGTSFPSGHVLTYTTFYGFLAYLVDRHVTRAVPRRAGMAILVVLIAMVGPSRVAQGHHWPTDVTASYLLGLAYLLGLIAVYERIEPVGSGAHPGGR
jgi:membrane-associated phospholipid phosphatase